MGSSWLDGFDRKVADGMVADHGRPEGLPGYLGCVITRVDPGVLIAEMEVRPDHRNHFGMMHGGVMSAFVDDLLGCVLFPLIPPGAWQATAEFKLNYLAPVMAGKLTGTSTVVAMTRSTAVVRVDVENDGRLVCAAQGTMLIKEPKAAS